MLIALDGKLVNLDRVCEIIPQERKAPGGFPIMRALFDNGDTADYSVTSEHMMRFEGTLVPALPGYTIVSALMPERGERTEISTILTPIFAFRVRGGIDAPVPVTVEGEPLDSSPYAVIRPDGKVSAEGDTFDSVEAWVRFLKRLEGE